jgi:cell wall-associated NlpC family hydrolase
MGSHSARHRSDRKQSEEMATDLLARLATEARPARRRVPPQFPLDPFATGPIPVRPPRPTTQTLSWSGSGATRCAGTTGRGAHAASNAFRADPATPFPIDRNATDAPAGLAFGAPAAVTARAGHARHTGGLRVPLYATVSATVITATAAVAASAGPVVITPANGTPDHSAASAAAGTAALSLALPATSPTPVTPQTLGGPAALLPPEGALAQGSAIVANANADAKALGAQQSTQQATQAPQGLAAALGGIPAHITPPTGTAHPAPSTHKPAPKATPAPAGSGMGARALALAKGKLGDPYVWGSAGPNAFDCSGLVVWAFKQLGKALPHSSGTLSTMGTPVAKSALQPGDLVFFYSPVSHVGIYAGNGMVLNATESGQPVQYSKLANLPFHNARRITV